MLKVVYGKCQLLIFFIPRLLDYLRRETEYDEDDIDMMRYSLEAILWEIEKIDILNDYEELHPEFDSSARFRDFSPQMFDALARAEATPTIF